MTSKDIGTAIKEARLKQGLSQERLARLADCSWGTVRNIERGDTPNPGAFTLDAIAGALGLSLDDLVRGGAA